MQYIQARPLNTKLIINHLHKLNIETDCVEQIYLPIYSVPPRTLHIPILVSELLYIHSFSINLFSSLFPAFSMNQQMFSSTLSYSPGSQQRPPCVSSIRQRTSEPDSRTPNIGLLPLKKEKQIMYATFASAIINLLLNFIFIPLWKQTGAAITTVVAEIVVMFWQVCAYKKSDHCIELRLNKSNLKAIFIACCVIILICVSVDTFQMKFIVAFFVKVILAIISYIIILVVLHHTIALKVIEFIRNCLKK